MNALAMIAVAALTKPRAELLLVDRRGGRFGGAVASALEPSPSDGRESRAVAVEDRPGSHEYGVLCWWPRADVGSFIAADQVQEVP